MKKIIIVIGFLTTLCYITNINAHEKYKYNSELTYEQALNIEPREFFQKTNPKYILNALIMLNNKAKDDEKSLRRIFILLPNCDAGYAEMIARNLYKIMLEKQNYFFNVTTKVDTKIQKEAFSDIIILPDNDFDIKYFKRNSNSEILFITYDEYIKKNKIYSAEH